MIHDREYLGKLAACFLLDEAGTVRTLLQSLSGDSSWLKPEQSASLVFALRLASRADASAIVAFRDKLLGHWRAEAGGGIAGSAFVMRTVYHFHGDCALDSRVETQSSTMTRSGFGGTTYMGGSGTEEDQGIYVISSPGKIWWVSRRGRNTAVALELAGKAMRWNGEWIWRVGG